MIITLFNDRLHIKISSRGAELISVKTTDNKEILWTGDRKTWAGHAPVLFPWTGRIKNKVFTKNGIVFEAGIHGFIRNTEHRCVRNSHENALFQKNSDAKTRKLFPYDFAFSQEFTLSGTTIKHRVSVTNTGATVMPFGLGFHPGFICPFDTHKQAADYAVFFDTDQSPDLIDITQNGLPSGKKTVFMYRKNNIPLSDELFKNQSLCFSGLTASSIILREKNASCEKKGSLKAIEVGIQDFPFLLLWSAPTEKLRFICIEPWYTLPDFENSQSEWETKQNLLRLESGKTFTAELNMTFHTR